MSDVVPDPFQETLAALLLPVAQAMIARGVTIGMATESLKNALVKAAETASDHSESDSKISLRTGLHRKDVKRLRNETPATPRKANPNAAALALSWWSTAPIFSDGNGIPRDLPRRGTVDAPGFDDLIRTASIDLPAATVLSELLDQGLVQSLPDGRLHLLSSTFVPRRGSEAALHAFEATAIAHLTAATHNLTVDEKAKRHFDRAVRYSHLSQASVDRLEEQARHAAQNLLEQFNILAAEMQQSDARQENPATGQFVLGAFILPTPSGPVAPEENET